jgi:hypothetical protein
MEYIVEQTTKLAGGKRSGNWLLKLMLSLHLQRDIKPGEGSGD